MSNAEVKPRAFRHDAVYRLHDTLRPVNPDNACTLRITATAGLAHVILLCKTLDYIIIHHFDGVSRVVSEDSPRQPFKIKLKAGVAC